MSQGNKIGEVKTSEGGTCYVYWNASSGEVHVAAEPAGRASSQSEAMEKAQYYANFRKIKP